jgi:hypothetical protein
MQGSRRITFDQFLDGLVLIAERKGKPIAEVVHTILATGGPAVSATKPEYVRLNDDKVGPTHIMTQVPRSPALVLCQPNYDYSS